MLGLRWVIANGLWVLARDYIADDLLRLACDVRYGRDREMLALALAKLSPPAPPRCGSC